MPQFAYPRPQLVRPQWTSLNGRWKFTFDKANPGNGHVRGVDVFKVKDGKVAEKLCYVKG